MCLRLRLTTRATANSRQEQKVTMTAIKTEAGREPMTDSSPRYCVFYEKY